MPARDLDEHLPAIAGGDAPKGEILVSLDTRGSTTILTVTDNGIGLPRENRQRLLEPYMTMREKGTGLGLAIVSRVMEEHGGRIELGDAPAVAEGGSGASIRLVFPDSVADASEAAAQSAEVH